TREYYGRLVFVCASTLNTTRVLLNSKSSRFPDGLANSSGVLGHYLMDHHFQAGADGVIEGLLDRYYQGNRPNGIYIPRFRNLGDETSRRGDYVRGFGYQGGASRPGWGRGGGERGFGVELKRRLRDPGGWRMGITGFGECLPGTARMGRDPKTSVLNGYNQAHDVPNLFVTDGACMASSACQNPSITYMALTARACDYAVAELKRGKL